MGGGGGGDDGEARGQKTLMLFVVFEEGFHP